MNHVDIRVAPHEPWYKYGVAVLLFEIAVAIAVSGYSLYMTFNGLGGYGVNQSRSCVGHSLSAIESRNPCKH
jgi:hypothetical protein